MSSTATECRFLNVRDDRGDHEIAFRPGGSLLAMFQDEGIEIAAVCGGSMSCATCHVLLPTELYDRLPAPSEHETVMLEESRHYVAGQSRLACQVEVNDALLGGLITVAPDE